MELTPLDKVLHLAVQGRGSYRFEVPRAACFGIVAIGGLLVSISHKAGRLFVEEDAKLPNHPHVLQSSVYFFRPVHSSPKNGSVEVRLVNASKIWTTLGIEIHQDGKTCMAGTFVFTDLTLRGPVSLVTGWKLQPPPLPASLASLERDEDPDWVSFKTPLSPKSVRNPQAYIKYYLPIKHEDRSYLDHWVTPAWKDGMWTDELLHFVIDNNLPYWPNLLSADVQKFCRYEDVIAAGLEQRQARKEGREDCIFNRGCDPETPLTWLNSSVSISTEVKKPLPQGGSKWLLVRCFSSKLENNRIDEQLYVMNEHGDLLAVTHHVSHVVGLAVKQTDKRAKF